MTFIPLYFICKRREFKESIVVNSQMKCEPRKEHQRAEILL